MKNIRGAAFFALFCLCLASCDTSKIARGFLERGIAYKNDGKYDRAVAVFTQAIRLDPANAEVYFERGHAYQEKSDYDNAIADFSEAIRIRSGYADAYFLRSFAYSRKGDYAKAVSDLEEFIRLEPDNTGAGELLEQLHEKAN